MRINPGSRRPARMTGVFVLLLVCAANQRLWADAPTTDPLLDLFIKKGFVTQQEAEQVEAEAQALRSNHVANTMPPMPPESNWQISKSFKRMQLFGDVRLRYEDRSAADPVGNSIDLARFRYAVRVGVRGDLFDNFYYGFRLDTGVNPRSSFVTFGTSSSGGPYQGPFGKSNAGIEIGQAYLGWRGWNWLDLTVGKMPNPLYTSSMVWSGNISPEGIAERLKYPVGPADFFANFGQFLYADFNPDSASPNLGVGFQLPVTTSQPNGLGQKTDNIFLLAWQGGVNYHITTNTSAKIAATLYQYVGLQRSTIAAESGVSPYFGDPYVGQGAFYYNGGSAYGYAPGYSGYSPGTPFGLAGYNSLSFPFNQVGLNHLLVLEIPFEYDFKIRPLDARLFGDFAYNLEGAKRAADAANAYSYVLSQNTPPHGQALNNSFPAQTHDVKAYQIGFDLGSRGSLGLVNGSVSRRHGWEIKTYWQHIEQYALDPNLLDSDFFEGRENMEGIYVAAAFGLTYNLTATFRYGHANRINDLLGTGGSNQDIPQINPINAFDIYQFDLTLKF